MDEQALRALIRETVSRHLAHEDALQARMIPLTAHTSHYRYALPDSGGPCLIEPTVPCTHCGYCQSHGH